MKIWSSQFLQTSLKPIKCRSKADRHYKWVGHNCLWQHKQHESGNGDKNAFISHAHHLICTDLLSSHTRLSNAALDLPETKRQLKLHYTVESFTKRHNLNPYDFLFAVEHTKRWGAVFLSKKGINNNHESSSYETHYMSSFPNNSFVWGTSWNFCHCAILIWTSEI